jgi:hypothetical protein
MPWLNLCYEYFIIALQQFNYLLSLKVKDTVLNFEAFSFPRTGTPVLFFLV